MAKLYPGIPFSPPTTLTENIGAADTIIKVADASVFPPAPNYATIGTDEDGETIEYAAKADGLLSGCTRGVEGTAKTWQKGEVIARNFTKTDQDDLIAGINAAQTTATAATTAADNAQQTANSAASAAEAAQSTADAALPKSGGVVTGLIEGGLDFENQIYLRRIAGAEKLNLARYKTENDVSVLDVRSSNNDYPAEVGAFAILVDGIASPRNNYEAANKLYVDSNRNNNNLLINTYWANSENIINQRGQSSYAPNENDVVIRSIDGAVIVNSTISVVDSSIEIKLNAQYSNVIFTTGNRLPAGTYTFSFLIDTSGLLFYHEYINEKGLTHVGNSSEDNKLYSITFTATQAFDRINIANPNGETKRFSAYAAKLELGGQQTLAHKENGAWVLNEIPDYVTELAKCQRYLIVYPENTYLTFAAQVVESNRRFVNFNICTPVAMRTVPSCYTDGKIDIMSNDKLNNDLAISSMIGYSALFVTGNILTLSWEFPVISEGLDVSKMYALVARNKLILSAEL